MTASSLIICVIVAILGLPELLAGGQDTSFCALTISVLREAGSPVPAAHIDLIDPSGKVVQSQNTVEGRASFCDIGFGYHSIRVRSDRPLTDICETTVKNVKAIYGRSQHIDIIMNICLYGAQTAGNACPTYLRISSPDGEKLHNVKIHWGDSQTFVTDEYGRTQIGIGTESTAELTIEKEGFVTQKTSIACPFIPVAKEVAIELQRAR